MRIAVIGGGPAGLYFALLAKKTWPDKDITVYERNAADDTFGFGVVFSDETLDNFLARDPESYDAITGQFAYWDEIDFVLHGETIRSTGHGFCGCGRVELLKILQRRCIELGVEMKFSHDIQNIEDIDADLVVGADGINSIVRETFADRLIITDDNPRNEKGDDIVQHILSGMNKPEEAVIERDREKAIAYAIANAESGDVVVVAGKGHETYLDVGGSRLIFSDASQVRLALQAREKK